MTLLSDVAFFFEPDHREKAIVKKHGLSIAEQEDHVRNVYLKELSQSLGTRKARVCVDLSHFTLLYFDGLIRVMRAERLPFKLVRIHRDAMEAARSFNGHFMVGYRPSDAPESLQLSVDANLSKTFSALEMGLYAADETEAQWRKILREWSSGLILTCTWAEYPPLGLNFIDECVRPIAHFLGLNTSWRVLNNRPHNNPIESKAQFYNDVALLMLYHSKMCKASKTYQWMGQTLPSGQALWNRQFNATTSFRQVSEKDNMLRRAWCTMETRN